MCSRMCSRTSFTELKNSAIISTQQYIPRRVRRSASVSCRVAPTARIAASSGAMRSQNAAP